MGVDLVFREGFPLKLIMTMIDLQCPVGLPPAPWPSAKSRSPPTTQVARPGWRTVGEEGVE